MLSCDDAYKDPIRGSLSAPSTCPIAPRPATVAAPPSSAENIMPPKPEPDFASGCLDEGLTADFGSAGFVPSDLFCLPNLLLEDFSCSCFGSAVLGSGGLAVVEVSFMVDVSASTFFSVASVVCAATSLAFRSIVGAGFPRVDLGLLDLALDAIAMPLFFYLSIAQFSGKRTPAFQIVRQIRIRRLFM